jgi:hypothetical protein
MVAMRPHGRIDGAHGPSVQRNGKGAALGESVAALADLDVAALRLQWRNELGGAPPSHLPRWLLLKVLAYRMQAQFLGDLDKATLRTIREPPGAGSSVSRQAAFETRGPMTRDGTRLSPGALLVREWRGTLERVTVLESGLAWNGKTYSSLSQAAKAITGGNWNGHRFFGLRTCGPKGGRAKARDIQPAAATSESDAASEQASKPALASRPASANRDSRNLRAADAAALP